MQSSQQTDIMFLQQKRKGVYGFDFDFDFGVGDPDTLCQYEEVWSPVNEATRTSLTSGMGLQTRRV
jgi:hypothetical protein